MLKSSTIKEMLLQCLFVIGLALISLDASVAAQTSIQLSLPSNVSGATGSIVSIPVALVNTEPSSNISSLTLDVTFNPNVLAPIQPTMQNSDPAIDRTNTLSSTCGLAIQDTNTAGRFNVSALGCSIFGSGTLVKMLFKVIGTAGNSTSGTTNLAITRSIFENQTGVTVPTTVTPGTFTVTTPMAASVRVSGRLLTAQGRAVRGAQVKLTNADGSMKTVTSGAFGNFRFADVPTGQPVTIRVFSKKYGFEPQTITVSADLLDLNFVSQP